MFGHTTSPLDTLRVRVNVTCAGTLLALNERGAMVQVPTAQRPQRQTTLAIEDESGETVYIPARVVSTEPYAQLTFQPLEHHVAMEFFGMSLQTAAAVRRIIERHYTPPFSLAGGAIAPGGTDTRYERVA
jgi:hypothetical protein